MMDQDVVRTTPWAAGLRGALLATALIIAAPAARAVNIVLDYTYDTSNFFGVGNPSGAVAGAQAKASLEAVASFYSDILNDTFSSIQKPPNFVSSQSNGVAFWDWSLNFNNPNTSGLVTLTNEIIPANEYRIYAGARNIAGTTLGIGGPGGYSVNPGGSGSFTPEEHEQLDAIDAAFKDDVIHREEPSGFARWGGAITFDSDEGTAWHFNHSTNPTAGTNDFFSVAVHELGHAIGLGASSEWNDLLSGGFFIGAAATSEYGSNPPASGGHWTSNTMSRIYGTNTPQEAAMDPQITTGTRKRLTALDAAALTDIGWEVSSPPVEYAPGDFNEDTFVDGDDLIMWRGAFGVTASADADGDGDSDGQDFLIWQRQVGALAIVPSGTASAAAVPEPSALMLAAASIIAWRRQTRRSD